MSPKRPPRPGPAEAADAARRLLAGLGRGDILEDLARDAYVAHLKNNTFPAEVYLRLATQSLQLSGADADHPIAQEGLMGRHLPEARFKGRENAKARFALLAAAAASGGLEVDLLDEVAYWASDDLWNYALCATVALIRAGAERAGVPVAVFVERLAEHAGIDLTADASGQDDEPSATIRRLR